MNATYGTNLDTGMSTITFDSTGRMVQFAPTESVDFDKFLRGIKMQGKICQDSIAHDGLIELQKLGKAIEEGDPNTISELWVFHAKKVLDKAILNGMIIKEETPNPFHLYYINDNQVDEEDVKMALKVSKTIEVHLDNLANQIIELDDTAEYGKLLPSIVLEIKRLYHLGVGLSDTASREAMASYIEGRLLNHFEPHNYSQMSQALYELL